MSLYLSHLLLQVVHGLSVLRGGGRRSFSQTPETQATALLLLFIQNLILRKSKRNEISTVYHVDWW